MPGRVSAATEKATRLTAAEAVARAASNRPTRCSSRAGDAAVDEVDIDRRTSAGRRPISANCCASMSRRACDRRSIDRSEHWMATMLDRTVSGQQIGRSVPRLEAREKVTGRAEYTHHLRLPGMLYGKIFRSTVRARPHQVDRCQRRAGDARRLSRRHHRRRPQGHPAPLLRPGLPRSADPRHRQGALCRRAGRGGARRRSACRRRGRRR